jgi:nickel-dependent lactate racemase
MSVTLAVTDATRPSPDHLLLPLLLEELTEGGVSPDAVTVLIALGMHRLPEREEVVRKLGPLADRLRVEPSEGADRASFESLEPVRLPGLPPVPITVHRRAARCDLLVATGWVEPHQYAGFSGGGKTVAVGCAEERTIGTLHGIDFLDHPGTRLGRLEGNPFQEVIREGADRARLAFVLNTAAPGESFRAAAGPPREVLDHLVGQGGWEWPVGGEPFDAVFAELAPSKGTNLYQASRALTYLVLADRPVVRPGGWIVVGARCEEGFGRGPGERAFREALRAGDSPAAVRDRLRREGVSAGAQRAYVVAGALERNPCLLVGVADPAALSGSHMPIVPDAAAAVRFLRERVGETARVLLVADALNRLPVPLDP